MREKSHPNMTSFSRHVACLENEAFVGADPVDKTGAVGAQELELTKSVSVSAL